MQTTTKHPFYLEIESILGVLEDGEFVDANLMVQSLIVRLDEKSIIQQLADIQKDISQLLYKSAFLKLEALFNETPALKKLV